MWAMPDLDDRANVETVESPGGGSDEARDAETRETTAHDDEALDAYSRTVTAVARRLLPSVASLRHGRGNGSAVILSNDGLLLTSAHVVGSGRIGSAVFHDGAELPYEVVGADRLSDLAVVRVAASAGLPAAELGDAGQLRVGQLVVAVGSPLGYAGSVSAGVVSAVGRSLPAVDGRRARIVEGVIQTDAALHPGNSGGALATSDARVVGINTAVVGPGIGQGLGMAIPLDATTTGIIGALIAHGRVDRAELGLSGGSRALPPRMADRLGRRRGVEVTGVVAGGPAARAGMRPEDIVVALGGRPIEAISDMQRLLTGEVAGHSLDAEVVRGGELLRLPVVPRSL
jgi:S1-C subfamily serine protease